MSELLSFAQLGVRHILDVEALDHLLFLVALAAIYQFRDLRAKSPPMTPLRLPRSASGTPIRRSPNVFTAARRSAPNPSARR